MEMTLSRLRLTDMRAVLTSTVLPIGILALIAMMVGYFGVFARYLLRRQYLVSLLILMVAINTFRPLDFSSFPTLVDCHGFATGAERSLHPHSVKPRS